MHTTALLSCLLLRTQACQGDGAVAAANCHSAAAAATGRRRGAGPVLVRLAG
jgi:hypothetical protein